MYVIIRMPNPPGINRDWRIRCGMSLIAPRPDSGAPLTGRRKTSRLRLGLPATVILISGQMRCRVDDLSQTGARITVAGDVPRVGADAVLIIEGMEAFGTVRWAHDRRFGLEFDEALPLQQVIAMRDLIDLYAERERELQRCHARDHVLGNRGRG